MTCNYYLQAWCTTSPMIPPLPEQSFPLASSHFEMYFNQQQWQTKQTPHKKRGKVDGVSAGTSMDTAEGEGASIN